MVKTKYNPTGYIGGATFDADPVLGAGAVPLTPNYGSSGAYVIGSALGCSTPTPGDANIIGLAVGSGVTDPVLGAATDGIQILG